MFFNINKYKGAFISERNSYPKTPINVWSKNNSIFYRDMSILFSPIRNFHTYFINLVVYIRTFLKKVF